MVMTFGGGLRSVNESTTHAGEYMQALSKGVLLSARGNSGVIFSQFVHGMARSFAEKETVSFADMADAFACAKEDAYHSILSPTEGTILTVIREAGEFLAENAENYESFEDGFPALQAQMTATLKKTPELLPVLKEAGVVDSGGAGLLCFVDGMCAHLRGEAPTYVPDQEEWTTPAPTVSNFGPDSRLEYGYCTEFILQLMNYKTDLPGFDLKGFTKPLEQMGDSIVAVHNDGIVKIHIHTFTPEAVLAYGRRFGEFITLKIENMSVQHSEIQAEAPKKEKVKYAIVAVAAGEGIQEYFKSIGATYIIDGGQTNNPPVSAFLEAFDSFDAEHIIVLPNNSNIVLTANQAADAYEGCDVRVIPTKSIVEGYSALSMMNPWCDTVEELLEDMTMNLGNVTTGYVTTAVRDTHMDGLDIHKDAYIGLDGKHILSTAGNRVDAAKELIKSITSAQSKDVIIVFYGESVTEEDISELSDHLQTAYPAIDVGFVEGKQSVYDFIISLE
jgi:DAK2 domain fusion protein YloV